jgi:hypothetical protein
MPSKNTTGLKALTLGWKIYHGRRNIWQVNRGSPTTHGHDDRISCTGYTEGTGTDPMTVEVGISEIPWCTLYGMVYRRKGAT